MLVLFSPPKGRVELGPTSVGYEITSKSLCFGGQQCTATDVAIAAGVAPNNFCTAPQALSSLSPDLVKASMDEIKQKLERIIDSMKVWLQGIIIQYVVIQEPRAYLMNKCTSRELECYQLQIASLKPIM